MGAASGRRRAHQPAGAAPRARQLRAAAGRAGSASNSNHPPRSGGGKPSPRRDRKSAPGSRASSRSKASGGGDGDRAGRRGGQAGGQSSVPAHARPPVPRHYDRPWRVDDSPKGKGKGKRKGKGRGRGSDGSGDEDEDEGRVPYSEAHAEAVDIELIRMVERDILDTSPAVRFDDIAGLDDAKGLI